MPSTIQEIETAVARLSPDEWADFRAWFAEQDAQRWEQQLAADVAAGRLDALADKAVMDLHIDRQEWFQLAGQSLGATHGADEHEYIAADVKQPNPDC